MEKIIKIGNKKIGQEQPVFIIAEAGVNHNGNFNLAKKLVDAAAKAGADAVKFQTFDPDDLVTKNAGKAEYQNRNIGEEESQYEMLRRLMLPKEKYRELKSCAEKKGLIFLSTPFSISDAEFLRNLGISAIKVGSTDTNNIPYLTLVAQMGLPIILSTGMSDLEEIKNSIETIKKAGNNELAILHCTTNYPTPYQEANLKAILTLRNKFGFITGYSDHTMGIEAPIAAVAIGAKIIEKHLTLDRNLPGPDHKASLTPEEFAQMVRSIRNTEKLLGTGEKKPFKSEIKIARLARKSLVSLKDIKKGEVFNEDNLGLKRPGNGLGPNFYYKVIGAIAKKNIKAETLIKKGHYGQ